MMSGDDDSNIDDDGWFKAIRIINKQVKIFREFLKDNDFEWRDVTYINEWNQFYIEVADLRDNADFAPMWKETLEFIFAEPENLKEYIEELLKMVPPVKCVMEIKSHPTLSDTYTLMPVQKIDAEQREQQITIHMVYCGKTKPKLSKTGKEKGDEKNSNNDNDDDKNKDGSMDDEINVSITSSLQNQVHDMEEKLDQVTKELKSDMGNLNANVGELRNTINDTISSAISAAFKTAQEQTEKMQKSIKVGAEAIENIAKEIKTSERTVTKLTGDIRN